MIHILSRLLRLCLIFAAMALPARPGWSELRGHGGPVRAVALAAGGTQAISGSFDTSAILWSLTRKSAMQVLRFHDGPVNAVAVLKDGRLATAGGEGKIALWRAGQPKPLAVLEGHRGPVVGLALSPDGQALASASWDHTVRLWPLSGDAVRVFQGHQQNVNGVAFTPDGHALVSAGYDATLRIWPLSGGPTVVRNLPTPLNAVAVANDGEIAAGGADGKVYFLGPDAKIRAELATGQSPIIALALSDDGRFIAAAGIRGSVAIILRTERKVVRTLIGPGLPVWSVAFFPDNHTLLTGGADRAVRQWDISSGEQIGAVTAGAADDPLAAYAGDPGAEVFRACVACHTLSPDEGNRAGPSLAGLFGRRIATLPGYNFSPALKKLNIVWTPETVSKLFEVGPAAYTPGTKMPEQTIGAPQDRAALVRFLEKATKKK
ncbi:MAG TPA: c-type cytochrome [Xanthobacteraceae bacterium]|nr:c-type cytochrome [Xanthobacteraceae bacterium]